MPNRIAGPKRKMQPQPSQAERLSAIAKHTRQVNAPAPALDVQPRMKAFDETVERLAEEVHALMSTWKFNAESICAEIERRANRK
jgi:hypothetical protein